MDANRQTADTRDMCTTIETDRRQACDDVVGKNESRGMDVNSELQLLKSNRTSSSLAISRSGTNVQPSTCT
jgi:hypothetical protein